MGGPGERDQGWRNDRGGDKLRKQREGEMEEEEKGSEGRGDTSGQRSNKRKREAEDTPEDD